ncbi:MAG: J domain-containing protein [Candidatus Nitrosopelagicus sp.]|nr:J domain-containing protein [Candidatus Nitrosopelagicus sp.]
MIPNYYEILGISKDATLDEIKVQYRELSLRFHPDKISSSLAQEMMVKINEAYFILSDSAKRKQYDQNFEISQTKTRQKRQKQAQKSTKSVWINQLKEIGRGLQKLWFQYLEFQKKNQANQKRSEPSEEYFEEEYQNHMHNCNCYHHCNCSWKCGAGKQKKKQPKQNDFFTNPWGNSQSVNDEFLNNMFGFTESKKEETDE